MAELRKPAVRKPPVRKAKTASILTKPTGMSKDASWAWDQISAQLIADKLAKPIDAAALEIACETFARFRHASAMRRKDGLLSENSQGTFAAPWVGIEERAAAAFKSWSTEYGLTPLARGAFLTKTEESEGTPGVPTLDDLAAKRAATKARSKATG
jgi:P27 family predicted phage terminase small subunit